MSQALYRKYRSRALAEIVGQEHITETLGRAIKAGHIGHAYLFTGPRGTGKTSVARILAHEINELPYSDTPQLDIVEIDAASNRRIDDIRDLREKVHIAPVNAKYKVYIIDEVHMLTSESFNALLKTLEEPPAHVVFILATTEVQKLPATIISRTQRFAFRPGTKDKVVAHLKTIATKEKIDIEDAALQIIAEHGEGSYRDSLSLLDQLTHISTNKITASDVSQTLGLAPQEQIKKLFDALMLNDTRQVLDIATALENEGSSPISIVNQLSKFLLVSPKLDPDLFLLMDRLLDVPRSYNPQLKFISVLTTFKNKSVNAHKETTEVKAKNTAALVTSAPVLTIKDEPSVLSHAKAKELVQEKQEKNISSFSASPLQQLSAEQWTEILAAIKQKNPPLFAIAKQAQPTVEDKILTLKFKFALMAKKLDDPKQKALLAEVVQQVTNHTPSITIIVDKNTTPPPITHNSDISKVAAIMGGGEVINAQTI